MTADGKVRIEKPESRMCRVPRWLSNVGWGVGPGSLPVPYPARNPAGYGGGIVGFGVPLFVRRLVKNAVFVGSAAATSCGGNGNSFNSTAPPQLCRRQTETSVVGLTVGVRGRQLHRLVVLAVIFS